LAKYSAIRFSEPFPCACSHLLIHHKRASLFHCTVSPYTTMRWRFPRRSRLRPG
jgi:hypothetical protein